MYNDETNGRIANRPAYGDTPQTNEPPVNSTASGSYFAARYPTIVQAYKIALGRDASDADIAAQTGNGSFASDDPRLQYSVGNIYTSPEAAAYRKSQSTPATPAPSPATGSPVSATGGIPSAPQGGQVQPQVQSQAVNFSNVPAYQPYQFNTPTPPAYSAPAKLLPNDVQANATSGNALLAAILANPSTMNDSVVGQMKEAQKEQALMASQQSIAGNTQSAAARGTLGSGATDAMNASAQQAAIANILSGNRNIDISAAQTNRQNQLDALNANNSSQSQALQSAIAGEQMKQAQADSQLRTSGFDLSKQQAQAGQNYQAEQDALQRILAQSSSGLDWSKFFENNREFNDTLGFNYNNLDQNGQLALLNYLNSK